MIKIRLNGVKHEVPENSTVYLEGPDGVEAVELEAEDALEILLAAVRGQAEHILKFKGERR